MIQSIKFGDVFKHKEKEYVFLAKTEELVYAGEILNQEQTHKINGLYRKISKHDKGSVNRPIFCYVILKTEEFKNRMVFLGKPGRDESDCVFDKTGTSLCQDDLQEIKREILNPESPVPIGLKKLVRDIDVQEKSSQT